MANEPKLITELPDGDAPLLTDLMIVGQDPSGTLALVKHALASIRNLFVGAPTASGDGIESLDGSTWVKRTLAQRQNSLGIDTGWITATGTWSYSSADAPTFIASVNADMTTTIYPGQRLSLTQTTEKFFIVTAVGAYSGGNTLITMYGGADYTLAAEAITSPKWSNVKVPSRFPVNPAKWTQSFTDSSNRTQATMAQNTWYNPNSNALTIPIGIWRVSYSLSIQAASSGGFDYKSESTRWDECTICGKHFNSKTALGGFE